MIDEDLISDVVLFVKQKQEAKKHSKTQRDKNKETKENKNKKGKEGKTRQRVCQR